MRSRRAWALGALCLVVLGGYAALAAATAIANETAAQSRASFAASSTVIAASLSRSIDRIGDLGLGAQALLDKSPADPQDALVQWATEVQAFERNPALVYIDETVTLTAAEIPAYAARAVLHPSGPLAPDGSFQVIPPGDRPLYCFDVAAAKRSADLITPAGLDFCADDGGPDEVAARDTGTTVYAPFSADGSLALGVLIPMYRDGAVPINVPARRSAFIGTVSISLFPLTMLSDALGGHPDTAIAIQYHQPGGVADVTFSSGAVPQDAESVTIDLQNGWMVQTFEPAIKRGVGANPVALGLLITGMTITVMLAALVFVLGTGRARALIVVRQRTASLDSSNRRLESLLTQTVGAAEDERTRLAMALHDGPIQRLAAVGLRFDSVFLRIAKHSAATTGLSDPVRDQFSTEINSLRQIMADLRPPALDQAGLGGALRDHAAGFARETGIACTVTINDRAAKVASGTLQTVLYRISQEALRNVAKHAQASVVEVTLSDGDTETELTITDNGKGFDTTNVASAFRSDHYGLASIEHRASMIGGRAEFISKPGSGTTVRVLVPHASPVAEPVLQVSGARA